MLKVKRGTYLWNDVIMGNKRARRGRKSRQGRGGIVARKVSCYGQFSNYNSRAKKRKSSAIKGISFSSLSRFPGVIDSRITIEKGVYFHRFVFRKIIESIDIAGGYNE